MRHASMKALISLKEEAAPAIPVLIQRLSESEDRELALGALRVKCLSNDLSRALPSGIGS